MAAPERLLEDSDAIRALFQRLLQEQGKLALGYREFKTEGPLLAAADDYVNVQMAAAEITAWRLEAGEKVALRLDDRGMKYEAVVAFVSPVTEERLEAARLTIPRTLRRADTHRVVDFVPDTPPVCTFTNVRNALLDGQVRGLGPEGLELALRDPRQNIQEFMRLGEESLLDLPLEGGPHLMAKTKVAYFEANVVGLTFTEQSDQALLGQYRTWLQRQQQVQAQRDRDITATPRGSDPSRATPPSLPGPRLWSDKDPLLLLLTEREDFARHMGEALGRKFGIASLDYIKGPLKPLLPSLGGNERDWGRIRMILIHNRLRVASPMELTRQIVEQEACPLPILALGTDEDEEVKRNRFIAAGAVDYMPVEPFRILTVLRRLDETLKLFA